MSTTTASEMGDKNTDMPFPGSETGSSAGTSPTIEQGLLAVGLPQYIEPCREYGVESWAKLSQLSESDFESLGVSLGHRRKLQRAFAQQHFWPDYLPLPTATEIKGFFPFAVESESSGSDESITPQPSPAEIPSQPTPARRKSARTLKQLSDYAPPGLEMRARVSIWVDNRK